MERHRQGAAPPGEVAPPGWGNHGLEDARAMAESAGDAIASHHCFRGDCQGMADGQSRPSLHASSSMVLSAGDCSRRRLPESGGESASGSRAATAVREFHDMHEKISCTHEESSLLWQHDCGKLGRQAGGTAISSCQKAWRKEDMKSAMDGTPNSGMLALKPNDENDDTLLAVEEKCSITVRECSVDRDDGASGMQASEEEEDRVRPSQEEKTGVSDEANTGTSHEDKTGEVETMVSEGGFDKSGRKRKNVNTQGSVVKKTKKKNTNVWAKTTSRKGGKKSSSRNGSQQNKNGSQQKLASQDCVYLTPVYRNQDKVEDGPRLPILLSRIHKAEKVELSADRLTAGSTKGYRMVKATRGVTDGAWYFEITVQHLGPTGHTRLGWSTQKGDVQAPVGFDSFSYAYRDLEGSKVHMAMREPYGESYVEGDVIGFYINLPNGAELAPKPPPIVCYKGQPWIQETKEEPPKIVPGSEISFFRNGVCQGVAFKDINAGRYYPAASMYTLPNESNCAVQFNFGPEFKLPPVDIGDSPPPRAMCFAPYCGLDGREIPFESVTGEHDGMGTSKSAEAQE